MYHIHLQKELWRIIFESLIISNLKNHIKVQFYILGYLDTNLSFGKKLLLPKGSPVNLAKIVYKNLNKKGIKKFFLFGGFLLIWQ